MLHLLIGDSFLEPVGLLDRRLVLKLVEPVIVLDLFKTLSLHLPLLLLGNLNNIFGGKSFGPRNVDVYDVDVANGFLEFLFFELN